MASKRALVNYNGSIGELQQGDYLSPTIYTLNAYKAIGSSTTFTAFGMIAPTVVGTLNARTPASTSVLTREFRTGLTSVATAAGFSSMYWKNALYVLGNGSGLGGFSWNFKFSITDAAAVAGARSFFGLSSNTAAPTNIEPNTLLNCIGLAQLSTNNTQFYICYGGSTAQTAIALGTAIGAPTNTGTLYDFTIKSDFKTGGVSYILLNVNTGVSVTGVLTGVAGVALPSATTYLASRFYRTNNATALAVTFDISSLVIEYT